MRVQQSAVNRLPTSTAVVAGVAATKINGLLAVPACYLARSECGLFN
jgi:hypothetical protein